MTGQPCIGPSTESPATGPVCRRCGRTVDPSAQRCACGVWQPKNRGALKTGARSPHVLAGELTTGPAGDVVDAPAAVALELATQRAVVERETGAKTTVAKDLARRFVETGALANFLIGKLTRDGLETPRGRTRAGFAAYLAAVDRLLRLAHALGLEPREKSANVAEQLAQLHQELKS